MLITNLIRDNWCRFQGELFPEIQDAFGPLLKNHQRFVMALGIICPEDFTLRISQRDGRPLCDRINLVRAFIAKAIWDIPTTRDLVEHLKVDRQMRNLCGWVLIHEIPSESTFSRAFAEFAESNLPGRMHEALVKEFIGDSIVGELHAKVRKWRAKLGKCRAGSGNVWICRQNRHKILHHQRTFIYIIVGNPGPNILVAHFRM